MVLCWLVILLGLPIAAAGVALAQHELELIAERDTATTPEAGQGVISRAESLRCPLAKLSQNQVV
jgi:hypothetical protein